MRTYQVSTRFDIMIKYSKDVDDPMLGSVNAVVCDSWFVVRGV